MACKVCVCLMQGEMYARKVWRFDDNDIVTVWRELSESQLLEMFPKVKSRGLRLDLTYEDKLVGEVNIESDT